MYGEIIHKIRHVARQHLHMTIAKNQNQVVIYVMLIQMELKAIAGELVHLRKHVNQVAGINQVQLHHRKNVKFQQQQQLIQ